MSDNGYMYDHDREGEIARLRAELAAERERVTLLEDMIGNVSRGVQSCRTDINMAVVWLPAIQRIHQYFRDKDEAESGDE